MSWGSSLWLRVRNESRQTKRGTVRNHVMSTGHDGAAGPQAVRTVLFCQDELLLRGDAHAIDFTAMGDADFALIGE